MNMKWIIFVCKAPTNILKSFFNSKGTMARLSMQIYYFDPAWNVYTANSLNNWWYLIPLYTKKQWDNVKNDFLNVEQIEQLINK